MFEIVIRPNGDLINFEAWDQFADTMSKVVDWGMEKIILDMINVSRMSSSYIGTVINCFKKAEEKGRAFSLINVKPKLYDLLSMLKLTEIMPIEPVN